MCSTAIVSRFVGSCDCERSRRLCVASKKRSCCGDRGSHVGQLHRW
jgi:hypothetical protein